MREKAFGLGLAGEGGGGEDERRRWSQEEDLGNDRLRRQRLADRDGVDPEVVAGGGQAVEAHPLGEVHEVLAPEHAGQEKERQRDQENEDQKGLVDDEHRRIIAGASAARRHQHDCYTL